MEPLSEEDEDGRNRSDIIEFVSEFITTSCEKERLKAQIHVYISKLSFPPPKKTLIMYCPLQVLDLRKRLLFFQEAAPPDGKLCYPER